MKYEKGIFNYSGNKSIHYIYIIFIEYIKEMYCYYDI